ncbi:hypothetical protein B9Z19DRAFT_1096684 [Tuber borchii]|uniref:Uncharacterized protein n=1 Tax=Tuber borchii TaxID=42251 RepID=A0A2T6ZBA4_TUBBO|nr:hypothetical protein B9Z19DRAFT_1096684 [Tuber borchii]
MHSAYLPTSRPKEAIPTPHPQTAKLPRKLNCKDELIKLIQSHFRTSVQQATNQPPSKPNQSANKNGDHTRHSQR